MEATTATKLSSSDMAFNSFVFMLGFGISVGFAFFMLTDPGRLTEIWVWIRSLHILWQGVLWLLLLPWMAALWVWTLPWPETVRVIVCGLTLIWTVWLLCPWN